ncbi:guanylate-binding protein [Pavlovales sp. CCMP2436]|nr:guanylate-binding protein [Pavlovales sp. CCMP2436]
MTTRVAPLIRHDGGDKGWRVCDEGAALLREIGEPVVVIAIAGLYRTGKSFLLNCIIGATGAKPALSVGSTSESCTRGIDICVTPNPLANGARLVLLDTEGLASMEQDEAYDAQVFALALLLSSYFVLNSMGVLDEAAIDRLYLIYELSKHVRADAGAAMRGEGEATDETAVAEQDLAQFFPPLLWVLRDFVVDLVADGKPISQDEYMEKALEPRPATARRSDERNRVRASVRNLFPKRACVTLVRPAADEEAVRHAANLETSELRPAFVAGMQDIQRRLLG